LGERLNGIQEVRGSTPLSSTRTISGSATDVAGPFFVSQPGTCFEPLPFDRTFKPSLLKATKTSKADAYQSIQAVSGSFHPQEKWAWFIFVERRVTIWITQLVIPAVSKPEPSGAAASPDTV
jgi:hypothetical protein